MKKTGEVGAHDLRPLVFGEGEHEAAIAETGATSVGAMVMHMDGGTKEHFMALLQREYPELVPMYDELYASRYVKKDYEQRVQEVVSLMRERYGAKRRR